MMNFSQNKEQDAIHGYFGIYTGTFLSLGENDGKTFSNVRALALKGWKGVCVEPGAAYYDLSALYSGDRNITCVKAAISTEDGYATLHDMGTHLKSGDKSLLATLDPKEKTRWGADVDWKQSTVQTMTYKTLTDAVGIKSFDFISIDCEGFDIPILRQINLSEVKCLCIEWNGKEADLAIIRNLVPVEMTEIYRSLENVIYARL